MHRKFTTEEDLQIYDLYRFSSPQKIAFHLDRARSSVEKRMKKLGLDPHYQRRPFKVWEETFIRDHIGSKRKHLASRLNRSIGSVQEKIGSLQRLRTNKNKAA